MNSHVENEIQRRIEAVRRREAEKQRQRDELAAARAAGLARRNAQKLYRQAHAQAQNTEDTPMAATKPVFADLHCPACRAQRRCRAVGTATVARQRREVVECGDPACGLQWIAARGHLTAAATA